MPTLFYCFGLVSFLFKRSLACIFCLLCSVQLLCAQHDTVLVQQKNSKKILPYVLPATLIGYGVITQFTPALQNFDHRIDAKIQNQKTYSFDDYILFAPYVSLYALDWCGIRAKHSFWERSFAVGFAGVATIGIVTATKHLTEVERPDKSNNTSFPSMHTAVAFVGAHSLFREYQDISPWIGVAGYAVAITTGTMRMVNHKHWLSDVLTGAGVGILTAELSYQLLPVWRKMFRLKERDNSFSITPFVSPQYCGVGINWKL